MDLNFISPINNLGYGVTGLNFFREFVRSGVDVKLWPIGNIDCCDELTLDCIKESIQTRHFYNKNAPSLRIWHQHDLSMHVGGGSHFGFPIFELDQFSNIERAEMSKMDGLFVCSKWASEIVLKDLGVQNAPSTYVIPLGVDRNIFHENIGKPDDNWTTFINIGKWEYRKGHDKIIEAFNIAFEPKDRVRLWMMNGNPFIDCEKTKSWQSLYKNSKMGDKVNFLPRVNKQEEVALIMSEADCGVFPSRAEGWNLELLEMMSMGKQVIATDYSAHTEFCNYTNCYLLPIENTERAKDDVFFDGKCGGHWAYLDENVVDKMACYMRDVYVKKNNGNLKINESGIETAKKFSWNSSTKKMMEILYA